MKNFLLLLSLMFITHAFAFETVKLNQLSSPRLYSGIFKVNYCADKTCSSLENVALSEKVTHEAAEKVIGKVQWKTIEETLQAGLEVEEYDIVHNPGIYEIIDLLQLDFSSADGDTPLQQNQINEIINLVNTRNAKIAITGILTEIGVSEHLVIYLPNSDLVYLLKRSQFEKQF